MKEEKKSQIRKYITWAELALVLILVIYLIYGLVTKNSNQLIFNIMAIVLVLGCVILNDIVEPYLTECFANMDQFRMEAYKKYVLWDVASMAGLLFFVLNFTENSTIFIYGGLMLFFVGSRQKRPYRSAYLGEVTKEDVEAAKQAADTSITHEE